MRRVAAWMFLLGMALFGTGLAGVAHAAGGKKQLDRWEAVEGLRPGMQVNVLAGDAAGPDLCLLSGVDDSALTCLDEFPHGGVRLVFPRSAVRGVWVFEGERGWSVAAWVKAILIGAAVGLAIACIALNPECVIVVGGIGLAVLSGGAVSNAAWSPPPRQPARFRWRLVYRVSAGGAVSP